MNFEIFNRLVKLYFGRGKPRSPTTWENQYVRGEWDRLEEIDELAHYSIITGYLQYVKQGPSLLDVGCGEGILQKRLDPRLYTFYIGIDLSQAAIDRASLNQDEKTFFFRKDAETYAPTDLFDVIIFNEALYYFDNPLEILYKYTNYLKKEGLFIVSMFGSLRSALIWRRIKGDFTTLDETKIVRKGGSSWICKVLAPPLLRS